jgi:hypothetical protein
MLACDNGTPGLDVERAYRGGSRGRLILARNALSSSCSRSSAAQLAAQALAARPARPALNAGSSGSLVSTHNLFSSSNAAFSECLMSYEERWRPELKGTAPKREER